MIPAHPILHHAGWSMWRTLALCLLIRRNPGSCLGSRGSLGGCGMCGGRGCLTHAVLYPVLYPVLATHPVESGDDVSDDDGDGEMGQQPVDAEVAAQLAQLEDAEVGRCRVRSVCAPSVDVDWCPRLVF